MILRTTALSVACMLLASTCTGTAKPHAARRALLIGINDYSAFRPAQKDPKSERNRPNLKGAVNDVRAMEELLTGRGFRRDDIVTLVNKEATRENILNALESHLVQPTQPGDITFFYFAGHGSQVRNSLSSEPDRMDESIVPADSRAGASDIRDKELRPYFKRILDRHAKLTIMLDHCHSGSGARTPLGEITRGIEPVERDAADGTDHGPAPEELGALVLAATADFDRAWELRDERNQWHGAFSWAWLRAIRDSDGNESALETFLRARAHMAVKKPFQTPVLGGNAESEQTPFLGMRVHPPRERTRVAVTHVQNDGTLSLQGGWVHGLSVGTELRLARELQNPFRVTITSVQGLERSTAQTLQRPSILGTGALLETVHPKASPDAWLQHSTESQWDYTLGIRDASNGVWANEVLVGGQHYDVVLRMRPSSTPKRIAKRSVYIFAIDPHGQSTLLYPRHGSVENRFPPLGIPPPIEIALEGSAFKPTAPYGTETFVLLAADEPLASPYVLQWEGTRGRGSLRRSAWSIERLTLKSIAPPQESPKGVL